MAAQLARNISADYTSIDNGDLGANGNHVRVWSHLSHYNTDWTIVLEDDAQPITSFPIHAVCALDAAPTPIVSFYLGRSRPPQWQQRIQDALAKADANNAHWITTNRLLHAVAVAVQTPLITPMLAHIAVKRYLPIDEAIGHYARTNSIPIAYTVPSLVNHNDTTPSISPHRDGDKRPPGRVAWRTGTHTNWNQESVTM